MNLQKLDCPNCGALLNMELTKGSDRIFCPYCGQQFHIDNGNREYTVNRNINYTKRDEAAIERAKASAKEMKYACFLIVFLFIAMILLFFFL